MFIQITLSYVVGRGCSHCPQSATAKEHSRQRLTTVAQRGSFPFKGRAAFFSSQQLLHTGSPTNVILAVWLLYTEKAVSKHNSCNNFMNILPIADTMENIPEQQDSSVKQKPQSQDQHIIWCTLVLPLIPFQVLGGRAKVSYLLIKVLHNSGTKQEEIANR